METPKELESFLSQKTPSSGQINIGFELFEFPSVEKLSEYQKGYRWHGLTNERVEGWKENWIVFGASNADPLIYNTDNKEVLFDRHGAGSWNPVMLFSNLDEMYKCLFKISKIVGEADEQLHDEDFNIRTKYVQEIKIAILNVVGSAQGKRIIEFLDIREY